MDTKQRQGVPKKAPAGAPAKIPMTGKGPSGQKNAVPAPATTVRSEPADGAARRAAIPPRPPAPKRDEDRSKNSLVFIPIDSLWADPPEPSYSQRPETTPRPLPRETASSRHSPAPEPLYRILFDSMYEAAFITNLSGIVADANTRAGELTGLHPLRLCGQPIETFVLGMDEMMLHRISDHVQMGRFAVLEGMCQRDDGEQVRVEITVSRINRSQQHELLFSLRAQSKRPDAKAANPVERRMLHYAPCGLALIDAHKRVAHVNPAFLRVWRHAKPEAVIGKLVSEVWPQDIATLFLTPLKTGAVCAGDISVTRPDGRVKSFQANAVPYPGKDGEASGVIISFIDITSLKSAQDAVRREAETQLRQASSRSDFSGSLNIVGIGDLIRLIASSAKTGMLEILNAADGVVGGASFESGQIVFAQFGNLHGEAAAVAMLRTGGVSFRFRNNHISARDENIRRTTLSLLQDAIGPRGGMPPYENEEDTGPLPIL